jgi:hypothetical protein
MIVAEKMAGGGLDASLAQGCQAVGASIPEAPAGVSSRWVVVAVMVISHGVPVLHRYQKPSQPAAAAA